MWKDVITADAWKTYAKSVRNRLLKLTQHKETSQDHNFLCAGKNNSSRKNPPSKIHRAHTVQQCNTTQCINIQYIHSHNYR